jgi:hypothetical protein
MIKSVNILDIKGTPISWLHSITDLKQIYEFTPGTFHSLNEMFGSEGINKYDSVNIEHDGSPVLYMDPQTVKGQMYAGSKVENS